MNTPENQSLFWDVDLKTLDADMHYDFIGKRVLNMGDLVRRPFDLDFFFMEKFRTADLKEALFGIGEFVVVGIE